MARIRRGLEARAGLEREARAGGRETRAVRAGGYVDARERERKTRGGVGRRTRYALAA
jgi:hypothetical protein